MNVICGFIEAITATIELIGMGVGNLSIIWSWLSGSLHCAEGLLLNPALSTICGPFVGGGCGTVLAGCQDFVNRCIGSPLGQSISQAIQSVVVK